MSRSYRKNVFGSWVNSRSMKEWRTQENRRLRHNAKQLINTCEDWDNLIIPILNDYETLWGSPQDGRKRPWGVPLMNQCEWDSHKWKHSYTRYWAAERLEEYYGLDDSGHFKNKECQCYHNKRNAYYWRLKRK